MCLNLNAQITLTSGLYNVLPPGGENGIIISGNTTTVELGNMNATFNPSAQITVQGGATLVISGGVLNFNDNCEILIEIGSHLKLNGAYLKHAMPIGSFWSGIKARSGISVRQFMTTPSIVNNNCTPVQWAGILNPNATSIIMEGSTIEQAKIGIETLGAPPNNQAEGCAIVRVRNSFFKNCEQGVSLNNNHDNLNRQTNASHIMNTDFIWDNVMNMDPNTMRHINLYKTTAYNIGGCRFINDDLNAACFLDRGTGIYAIESSFSIKSDGDKCCTDELGCPDNCYASNQASRRNEFRNLGKGIYFRGTPTFNTLEKFSCKKSDFNECALSIEIHNVREANIGNNTFNTTTAVYNSIFQTENCSSYSFMMGIFYKNVSGITIFQNNFTTELDNFQLIRVEAPDLLYQSAIRNNEFNKAFWVTSYATNIYLNIRAINLSGNNNHLDIICNKFYQFACEIFVEADGSIDDIPNQEVHELNVQTSNLMIMSAENDYGYGMIFNGYYNIINEGTQNLHVGYYPTDIPAMKSFTNTSFHELRRLKVIEPTVYPPPYPQPGWDLEDYLANTVQCQFNCQALQLRKTNVALPKLNSFKIYPNPSSTGQINIELTSISPNTKYEIYNSLGQKIDSGTIFDVKTSLNIDKKGFFIVKIINENSISSQTVIIQ